MTSPVLEAHQFEVDGVVFGIGAPISTDEHGFIPGGSKPDTQDKRYGGGDGRRFGRDTFSGSTWAWSLFSNAEDEESALSSLQALRAVWPSEELRKSSRAVTALRYSLGGRVRRIYGRPRRFTDIFDNRVLSGVIPIETEFDTVDHLHYDDAESTSGPLTLIPRRRGGMIVPLIPPVISRAASGPRMSSIEVTGDADTPAWVTLTGPVSGARVKVSGRLTPTEQDPLGKLWPGWVVEVSEPIASNDPVTVDGRPWVRSATKRSGGTVRVSPRVTRIAQMMLPPGRHEIVFTGQDNTGTATATVSWRNANRSR